MEDRSKVSLAIKHKKFRLINIISPHKDRFFWSEFGGGEQRKGHQILFTGEKYMGILNS